MWQLVFASCHRLILNNNNNTKKKKNMAKGCLMVMADPMDLGHGKKRVLYWLFEAFNLNEAISA